MNRIARTGRNPVSAGIILTALVLMAVSHISWAVPSYTLTDLGTLGGKHSAGYGINDSGQVVGYSYTPGNNATHTFLYSNGTMIDLGTLGGTNSNAWGINDSGQVVGVSDTAGNTAYHAFLYSNGTMIDLGTLGGSHSFGYGINDSGQVVGVSDTAGNAATHAFLYSNGTMIDLGTLGGTNSLGLGINNSGQVVGYSYTPATTGNVTLYPFLYSNGTMIDLNTLIDPSLGWTLINARDINNHGQIVGYGTNAQGKNHAFLLTPVSKPPFSVPEPESLALIGIGLFGLCYRCRRSIG